mgnify:CR=1 FL=1
MKLLLFFVFVGLFTVLGALSPLAWKIWTTPLKPPSINHMLRPGLDLAGDNSWWWAFDSEDRIIGVHLVHEDGSVTSVFWHVPRNRQDFATMRSVKRQ